mmetsp:Transcript_48355/g.126440  ORF Transcript_48355/g.126440 Transcript_48355/m.126440 type:complete len:366 (+) Transcript_48355:42-1139(+)
MSMAANGSDAFDTQPLSVQAFWDNIMGVFGCCSNRKVGMPIVDLLDDGNIVMGKGGGIQRAPSPRRLPPDFDFDQAPAPISDEPRRPLVSQVLEPRATKPHVALPDPLAPRSVAPQQNVQSWAPPPPRGVAMPPPPASSQLSRSNVLPPTRSSLPQWPPQATTSSMQVESVPRPAPSQPAALPVSSPAAKLLNEPASNAVNMPKDPVFKPPPSVPSVPKTPPRDHAESLLQPPTSPANFPPPPPDRRMSKGQIEPANQPSAPPPPPPARNSVGGAPSSPMSAETFTAGPGGGERRRLIAPKARQGPTRVASGRNVTSQIISQGGGKPRMVRPTSFPKTQSFPKVATESLGEDVPSPTRPHSFGKV